MPGTNTYVFCAGKNGNGLGWTDAEGKKTLRVYYRWSPDGKHFWCDVPKDEWASLTEGLGMVGKGAKSETPKPTKPPLEDEIPVALEVFKGFGQVVTRKDAQTAVREAVNNRRDNAGPSIALLSRDSASDLLTLMNQKKLIRILPKGKVGCMCGLPDVVDKYQNPPLINVEGDSARATVPGSPEADEPPALGRSQKALKGEG